MYESPVLQEHELNQFHGSEQFYRHGIARKYVYTEGVQYLAERAGAYWLIDEIVFAQAIPGLNLTREEFQTWTLTRHTADSGATITCDDGNGNVLFRKDIPFTDFPLPHIKLFLEFTTILLPSEH